MITNGIFFILHGIIWLILSPLRLFEDVDLPDVIDTTIATASEYITPINNYFPIDTLLVIFGIIITIETAIIAYKGIMWLIKKLPFVGG